ncbi:DUF6387 family protein [Escherichia coli]|uniref:DUF6387 family protein n=1 Tax=Escherichia coli TaxID=562 RepID=UPI0014324E79|nr:DUF6387 family protein [Escherichia coli]EIP7785834.1 hypothetical protein [Escherichia coli]ELK9768081.1 hypothetical protein [Escherichia coli]MBV7134372.1 hypothetical protein [Escherichia coli]MCW9810800.1 DUF6387 family protein [Escherichia coli]MCW9980589.1 DUF6387 family protein [Escherichia coli]
MISFKNFAEALGFNLGKYEVFTDMSDFELITQLMRREDYNRFIKGFVVEDEEHFMAYLYENFIDVRSLPEDENEAKDIINSKIPSIETEIAFVSGRFRKIFASSVIGDDIGADYSFYEKNIRKELYKGFFPHMLSSTRTVVPLRRIMLENYVWKKPSSGAGTERTLLLSSEDVDYLSEYDDELLFTLANESLSAVAPELMKSNSEGFSYAMHLSLDITKTDDEILSDLKKLLPIWRKELNLEEPEPKRAWGYLRERIIKYKIIPLMDLLMLAKFYTFGTKRRVPKRVLASMIYPNGERDGFGLEQTVIPFLEKIRPKIYKLLSEYKINKEK